MEDKSQVVKVKAIAKYNGHSIKNNKSVDLSLVFGYDEMSNYIQLIQMLNENIDIKVKIGDSKPIGIGMFMIRDIKIDHDGQGVIKFNSLLDHVEPDEINTLVGETFTVLFKATIEGESEDV